MNIVLHNRFRTEPGIGPASRFHDQARRGPQQEFILFIALKGIFNSQFSRA
jgi:hypothetical protein